LTDIVFAKALGGSKLKTIAQGAFRKTQLRTVQIPASVETIGKEAFSEVTNADASFTVTFESGSVLTSIGEKAFYNSSLTSIEIPASTYTLGRSVFEETKKLREVIFAKGSQVGVIPVKAFFNSGLSGELKLPTVLTQIGEAAFQGAKISTIDIFSTVTRIEERAFANWGSNQKIYLPFSRTEADMRWGTAWYRDSNASVY